MSKQKPTGASDAEVIAMLKRCNCPPPFHEVRTRFLGNIASPVLGSSPMEPASPDDIAALFQSIQQMTIIAETEMNKANMSCKRARRQALETMSATKPTLH